MIQKLRWKRRKDLDDAENVLAVRAKKLDYMAQVSESRIQVLLPEVVRALRSRSQRERIQMAYDSNRLVRERLRTDLKFVHPNWSLDEIEREIAKRVLHGTS